MYNVLNASKNLCIPNQYKKEDCEGIGWVCFREDLERFRLQDTN